MSGAKDAGRPEALRRFKRYPAYKESGVEWLGQIPAGWDLAPVYARYEVALGKMLDAKRVTGKCSGRYLRNVDVQWNRVNTEGLPEMDFAPWERDRYSVRPGDLLVCEGGEVGRTAVWRGEIEQCFYQKALHRVRPRTEREIPRFFYYLMYMVAKRGVFAGAGNQNTIDHLTAIQLRHYRFPFASEYEQRAIAAFLDRETARIDALVAKKERLIELLQEQRSALVTDAVTKGLDPNVPMKDSGVEWLGEIPAHWEVKRIKMLSRFVTSGSRGWAEYYADEGALFLRIGNLRTASIELDLSDVQHVTPPPGAEGERTRVRSGDVLISITALIGAVGVVPEGTLAAFVNQHLALIRLSGKKVLPRWLAYGVLSRVGQEQLRAELYGGTKDGLSLDDIRSLAVLIPNTDEQERVVNMLDCTGRQADTLIAKVRDAIEHLKELRTALISAAVTGKIDVREEVA